MAGSGWKARLQEDFHPRWMLPSLLVAVVTAVNGVASSTAFAALIFSDGLSAYVSTGIGFMLLGFVVISGLTGLTSSLPGVVAGPNSNAVAILALVSAAIASRQPASAAPQDTFLTVVAAIALTSLMTGIVFLLLGQFELGNLVRFIPYPVVGGFLAGSGLLLVWGALSVMVGERVALFNLAPLTRSGLWIPGACFAAILLFVSRRYKHFLLLPGMLLAAIGVFYVVLWLSHTSPTEASDQGWLLTLSTKGGGLWQPLGFAELRQVNWSVVLDQLGDLAAIGVISVISILLNASGIELAIGRDIDLNRELKAAGISNVFAGLGGALTGYHALGGTMISYKIGAKSRLVGLFRAIVCGLALLTGGGFLAFFPKPAMGGLLLFLGSSLLVNWVYGGWFRLPKADYFIVVMIVLVISAVGFLQGVALGLVVAVILFVINYSRTSVVRHDLSGTTYQSNVDRPRLYQQLLRQKGHWLYILELQGFIFFGTANTLLDRVRQRLNDPDLSPPRFVVLDFCLVSGLDSSAALSFVKMKQLAQKRDITLVFSHLSPQMQRQLEMEVFQGGDSQVCRIFPDLDHAIEWCEDQLIRVFEEVGLAAKPKTIKQQLEEVLSRLPQPRTVDRPGQGSEPERLAPSHEVRPQSPSVAALLDYLSESDRAESPEAQAGSDGIARLAPYLQHREVEPGEFLIRQGNPVDGLYFIEDGQVTVQIEAGDQLVRLRTMGMGTIVGEMSLYSGRKASASVVVDQPSTVWYLSIDSLRQMEAADPAIAIVFHRLIAGLLGERLSSMNDTLQALMS